MRERFDGDGGRALLLDVLLRQDIVQRDVSLATTLVDQGELCEYQPGDHIVTQGACDNDVYFLLAGESNVLVNDRFVGSRIEGTCIGEMSALDASASRSATVEAKTTVVALKVSESTFRVALERHPIAFKALAQLLAVRLRRRLNFVHTSNPVPLVVIGSSGDALPMANELQTAFKHDRFDAVVWPNGVFGHNGIAFESLAQVAGRADFAAFVVSPDDKVTRKHNEDLAPRDNLVFALGVFLSQLAHERVFLIKPQDADVKVPTDLLGVTQITYGLKPGRTIEAAIAPVCLELRKAIASLGLR